MEYLNFRIILAVAMISMMLLTPATKAFEPISISLGVVVIGGVSTALVLTLPSITQLIYGLSSLAAIPTPGTGPQICGIYPSGCRVEIKPYTPEDLVIVNSEIRDLPDIPDEIYDRIRKVFQERRSGIKKLEYEYSAPPGYYYFDTWSTTINGFRYTYIRWAQYPGETLSMMLVGIEDVGIPTVNVMSPNGGEILFVGDEAIIRWSASDNTEVNRIDIYYSVDDGKTWQAIETRLSNTGSHIWTVPNVQSSRCRIKIEAFDNAGNKASDVSDRAFTIKMPSVSPGWKFSSYDIARTAYYPIPSTNRISDTPFETLWSSSYEGENLMVLTGDVNGDGKLEVVKVSGDNLKVISGDGKGLWARTIPGVDSYYGTGWLRLDMLEDVTGDGVPEISFLGKHQTLLGIFTFMMVTGIC